MMDDRARPLRVLCLDIEGGHGGSSRSLYYALKHMDRRRCVPEVWSRRRGAVQPMYEAIGIPTRVEETMPRLGSLPRLSRNLYAYGRGLAEYWAAADFRNRLVREGVERFDAVHLNHEGLFLLARMLRKRARVPLTMHIRTNMIETAFSRFQLRTIADAVDRLVFITENERRTFERFAGRLPPNTVIYNIAEPLPPDLAPHDAVPRDGRFRIACLSNFALVRGTDRVLDIAAALAARGRRDVQFVMAGDMQMRGALPPALAAAAGRGGSLADAARARGLDDMFLFLGHVAQPERVLFACGALIKPTRESNPWGRDIIEALAAARPVLSCGTYATFVEDGVTGVLQAAFDPAAMADSILAMADDPALVRRLGEAGRERVARLCDGGARAADLLAVWQSVAGRA